MAFPETLLKTVASPFSGRTASDVYTQLAVTQAALAGVEGVAIMADQTAGTLPGEHVRTLMPALQHVLTLVERADAPMDLVVAFRDRLNDLAVDTLLDLAHDVFHALAHAAHELEDVLQAKINQVEILVETERRRLMQVTILGSEKDLKLIERHRARLAREMESHLRLLQLVREVAVDFEPSGSFVIELKVLGRSLA